MPTFMKLVYPDTIIWNLLCDQNVDPAAFLHQLNAKGYTLAHSFHTVYELGRNVETDGPSRIARGMQLFSYLKQYLDLGIPCTKELWELIVAEAYARENNLPDIDPMTTPDQCDITKQEVGLLANGTVGERVRPFIEERKKFAEETRDAQKSYMAVSDELRNYLKAKSEKDLASWMQEEVLTDSGTSLLYRRFVKKIRQVPVDYIRDLLRFPLAEASRATVRADLYYNWHCAKHSAIRLDLLDDLLHVLHAMYCDLYVTEEKNHAVFAPLILTSKTKIAIYPDRKTNVDQWILGLL
jgi:hypothetical protein